MNTIGLTKEEKAFETRVPVIPKHIMELQSGHKISFMIEPSDQRAFGADEYETVGAEIHPLKGSKANVILGIKEMPIDFFEQGKVYIFFSHTIKAQKYNMPMLKRIIDVGATLIDYERVVDTNGRRLIFFGNWAGLAGMAETLRVLGARLEAEGISPNPFAAMKPTMQCKDFAELKTEFFALGKRIEDQGLPDSLTPFVVGFSGYGNVSRGAQEMLDLLPHETVSPENLSELKRNRNILYKCIFMEHHMVKPKLDSTPFDLQDYYSHGTSKYKGDFEKYVPYLTVLMNCIYWTPKYPRLITIDFIKSHWDDEDRKLRIVGDISCDVKGSIEFTVRCTDAGNPSFTYLIKENRGVLGVEGNGPVVMAVDNLPCELPRESSTSFSETLLRFIPLLAMADFTVPFEELQLSRELKDAIIVYQGHLVENYKHLEQHIPT